MMKPALAFTLLWFFSNLGIVQAASYRMTDGTDAPIGQIRTYDEDVCHCDPHPYAGPDLVPGANYDGAALPSAWLIKADLRDASLRGADLGGRSSGVRKHGANLTDANLDRADLSGADLRGAVLYRAKADHLDLSGADISGASLMDVDLSTANLAGVFQSTEGLNGMPIGLPADYSTWGAYILGPSVMTSGLLLSRAEFTSKNLSRMGLGFSTFSLVTIQRANLSDSDLSDSVMSSVRLIDTSLTGTNLARVAMFDVDFGGSDVTMADFSGATFDRVLNLGSTVGRAMYSSTTDFSGAWADSGSTPFDPVEAGWMLVPEPTSSVFVGLGLVCLSAVQRRCAAGKRRIVGAPFRSDR